MVKQTILGHLKGCTLWDVDNKLISNSAVLGHRVIFLDHAKGHYVSYPLGVIPYRIRLYEEFTNFVGVCHSCVTMDT